MSTYPIVDVSTAAPCNGPLRKIDTAKSTQWKDFVAFLSIHRATTEAMPRTDAYSPITHHMSGRKLHWGGGDTEAHFPNPPPPSLAAMTGGGAQGGGAVLPCRWGGGSTQHLWLKMIPTSR